MVHRLLVVDKYLKTLKILIFLHLIHHGGVPNRLILPNINSNFVTDYTIVKRELVVNGLTKTFKNNGKNESVPFLEIFLPDLIVLSVERTLF